MNAWYDKLSKIKLITSQMNIFLYSYDLKLFQMNYINRVWWSIVPIWIYAIIYTIWTKSKSKSIASKQCSPCELFAADNACDLICREIDFSIFVIWLIWLIQFLIIAENIDHELCLGYKICNILLIVLCSLNIKFLSSQLRE